ncbi:hypothetical protein DFJ58DRAFT_701645 [Suillus subalutaceus]|uniref:uncharacterized protein n=1 Tax=Suillus subalutaceus TaxID=48586 RepID=UPI001B88682D|nr:uncharacterized protein DFJ58DRAFT_701645 [Suillus subalutaceus]KAG1859364.1 hypothetical protein DFJ58DRAFT_701645 [Suillus subalutaceus]
MKSDAKLTVDTGTDFYDRSLTSRRYARIGVAFSSIFSFSCIVAGIVILTNHGIMGLAMVISDIDHNQSLAQEILTLTLNFIVMLCTESTGLVHGISLRSALASESCLHFNTNLRLLTAARGWYNPNGALLNGISAVLLIVSYSSTSLIVCPQYQTVQASGFAFIGLPLLILGVALLIQVMIALSGMRAVKILTWSSSPFDLTAALVHHTQLAPVTFRCMCCVSDLDTFGGPAKPSEIQPSAWHAHPSIRKVVIFLWVVVAACAGWAALIMYFWDKYHTSVGFMSSYALTTQTWSFIPDISGQSNFITYIIPGLNLELWILLFVNTAAIQGPLTLELHCSVNYRYKRVSESAMCL